MSKQAWFPMDEYEQRVNKARKLMAREGVDLLFITGDRNYNYFSGHRPVMTLEGTVARPNYFLLSREGTAHLMVHKFVVGDASSTTWIENISTYTDIREAPIQDLVKIVRSMKSKGKRIGVELGQEQRIGMPLSEFTRLTEELADYEFIDVAPLLWELRIIKSRREIECIRQAMDITARGYIEGFEKVSKGMTEKEVARELTKVMIERGAEYFWIMITSGPANYTRISGKPTDRQIQDGDMVWVDMGAMVNDYWADYSRAGVVGGPTTNQVKYQKIIIDTTAKGIAAVRSGVKGSHIVDVCEEALRSNGVEITFSAGRIGHGIGMLFTEPPSLARWDPVVLQENMVVSVEPGLVREDGIYHVEENILVTEKGSEILSCAPRELWVLG